MKKSKAILDLICNILMPLIAFIAIFRNFFGIGNAFMEVSKGDTFNYFTIDSNILCAVFSMLLIPYDIKYIKGETKVPKTLLLLKYIGTVGVTVTFLTCVFFLGPIMAYFTGDISMYFWLFSGNSFYLHLICPLLAIISYIFFESVNELSFKECLLGLLPLIIYGTVYFLMVLVYKKWDDFYYFNMNGTWYISLIAMLIGTFIICILLRLFHNKQYQKNLTI